MNNNFLDIEDMQLMNMLICVIDKELSKHEFIEIFRSYDKGVTKKEIFSIIEHGEFYLAMKESYLKIDVKEYFDEEDYTLIIRNVELILKGLNNE